MYPPKHHQSHEIKKMIAVIQQYPLGMLVTTKNNTPYTTHIPIIYNATTGHLAAHIDKHNPQVATLKNGDKATVIFKGPDTYISPSIYTTKQLPTWNYIIVHITGIIQEINDPEAVKDTIIDMTHYLEGSQQAYILDKDNKTMDRLVAHIHTFEITDLHWEGKFKLSQDKTSLDQQKAKEALIKKSNEDITGFINTIYDF